MAKKQKTKPEASTAQSKRPSNILTLVVTLGAFGALGYGHIVALPAYKNAVENEKQASAVYHQATEKQKKERKGKKGSDGPEVTAAQDASAGVSEEKETAMFRVVIASAITLVLGLIGFVVGLKSLVKTKWTAAKIGKRLIHRVFAIASVGVGSAGLYLGMRLLWAIS